MKIPILTVVLMIASCDNGAVKTPKKQAVEQSLSVSDSKLGIGLIHFSVAQSLPLFRSEQDGQPYDTLHFVVIDTGQDKGSIDFQTKVLKNKLQPYLLSGGDGNEAGERHINMGLIRFGPQLVFRVQRKTDKGVQVVVNEQTLETSFIPINPTKDWRKNTDADAFFDPNFAEATNPDWYYYETWDQALKRAWEVDYGNQSLVSQPNGVPRKIDPDVNLKVDSLQGDWIRMVSKADNKVYGWAKWKQGDSIIVRITLNGGYE